MCSKRVELGDGVIGWCNTKSIFHRTDGPALIFPNGRVYWYINGAIYQFDEWCDHLDIDEKRRLLLKIQYA